MGFTFLKCHNPEIDWKNREMKFTRCSESCPTSRACKNIIVTQEEANKLELDKQEFLWDNFLDDQGEIDPENKFITWTNNLEIAEVIADHSEKEW